MGYSGPLLEDSTKKFVQLPPITSDLLEQWGDEGNLVTPSSMSNTALNGTLNWTAKLFDRALQARWLLE
jgi:hypothetical protein